MSFHILFAVVKLKIQLRIKLSLIYTPKYLRLRAVTERRMAPRGWRLGLFSSTSVGLWVLSEQGWSVSGLCSVMADGAWVRRPADRDGQNETWPWVLQLLYWPVRSDSGFEQKDLQSPFTAKLIPVGGSLDNKEENGWLRIWLIHVFAHSMIHSLLLCVSVWFYVLIGFYVIFQ